MEDEWRSRSYGDGRMVVYGGGGGGGGYPPPGLHELRCYSASYATSQPPPPPSGREIKLKKGKSISGSSSSSSSRGGWVFNDPEIQRKKRVASYKVYSVESKMKGSVRKSFRWIKDRYTQVLYGWW